MISAPMRTRFGLLEHLDFWNENDLFERVRRSAEMLKVEYEEEALWLIARRSRGTPRITNRLLRRVRDYAQVRGNGKLTPKIVEESLKLEGVDYLGLDELDRKFLRTLIDTYRGGTGGDRDFGGDPGRGPRYAGRCGRTVFATDRSAREDAAGTHDDGGPHINI